MKLKREDDEGFTTDEYEIKLLLAKPQFQQDVLTLRKKMKIPPDGYPDNHGWNAWNEALTDEDQEEFQADLYELIDTHSLSDRWSLPLRQYLLDNVATRLRAAPYTEWKFDYEGTATDPKNIHAVWIKVDADTTQPEIIEALKQAKSMLPRKRKKQAYTYLDRALRAKELKQPGVTWSSVTNQLNDEFGTTYEENYVIKMVSRLEAHL